VLLAILSYRRLPCHEDDGTRRVAAARFEDSRNPAADAVPLVIEASPAIKVSFTNERRRADCIGVAAA